MMNNDITICKANETHIDGIFNVSTLSFHISWSIDSIKKEIVDNKNAIYIVAVKDNQVIGYGGSWVILDEGHITNIAVSPKYRGMGIASLILDNLMKSCKCCDVVSMTLEVRKSNIPAQNLYKKFNFIEEGLRKNYYADNKEDALIMWNHNI